VTYRGKEKARLVPSNIATGRVLVNPRDHPACGMWKDREDMADPVAYIRKLRHSSLRSSLRRGSASGTQREAKEEAGSCCQTCCRTETTQNSLKS